MSTPGEIIDPGRTPSSFEPTDRPRRRRRGRVPALITAFVLLITCVVWAAWPNSKVPGCAKDNPGLHWVGSGADRECIGVMNENPYVFAGGLAGIIEKIAAENRRVREAWESPPAGATRVPYVKVAVLTPLTGSDTTALPLDQIRMSLEGAYTAQCRANSCPALPPAQRVGIHGTSPNVQLVLANEGRNQAHWKPVVDQLASMTGGEHPLVAATGLGISIPATGAAATALSARHIAAIGAVISATDLTADQFFKVSPSNMDSVKALAAYAKSRPGPRDGYLIYASGHDSFTETLRAAFEKQFNGRILGRTSFVGKTMPGANGVAQFFYPAVQNICQTHAKTVFYAGRSRDLPGLVRALAGRDSCGHREPITVLTCSTGLWGAGQNQGVRDLLISKHINLVDASATDSLSWIKDTRAPSGFQDFHTAFRTLKFADEDLESGYAILHHDAVAVAVHATRSVAGWEGKGPTPGSQDVANQIPNLNGAFTVPAASGDISFDAMDITGGWPRHKPVPIIILPDSAANPPTPVYLTP